MLLKRTVATSLLTGEELEFFEPVKDEVEHLLEVNDRDGRLRERIMRRMIYGLRPSASGEVGPATRA